MSGFCSLKSFQGISSLTNSIISPPYFHQFEMQNLIPLSQIGLRENMDLLLFLKSAKCLINAEQFLVVFQIHFLNNLYLRDQ